MQTGGARLPLPVFEHLLLHEFSARLLGEGRRRLSTAQHIHLHTLCASLAPPLPLTLPTPQDEYEYASTACENRRFSMYILYFLWAKDAFGFLYCATHYLQLDGPRKSPPPAVTAMGALCNGLAALFYLLVACITVPVRKVSPAIISLQPNSIRPPASEAIVTNHSHPHTLGGCSRRGAVQWTCRALLSVSGVHHRSCAQG
jgi:hypothetical protein